MTTEHELDAILRRALHAAVDSVEPPGDGLQVIQRRLEQPRLQRQLGLLLTETVDLIFLIGIRLEPAASWARAKFRQALASVLAALRPAAASAAAGRPRRGAAHRSRPPGRLASRLSPAMSWLRPTLAVAGAVVIVVAGVATLFTLRQSVTDISLLTGGSQATAASAPAGSSGGHSGAPGIAPASPQATGSKRAKGTRRHATPVPTCTPGTAVRPPGISASPTVSPSPSDSATVTPSPTDTTSPSPAPTGTAATNPPAAVGGGAPVQLTTGCYGTKKSVATSPTP